MSDLIYKDDAIKAICNYFAESDMPYEWHRGVISTIDIIDKIPSVEPKKGQWIPFGKNKGWICSKCRQENHFAYIETENGEYQLQDYYCPHCGAEMGDKGRKLIDADALIGKLKDRIEMFHHEESADTLARIEENEALIQVIKRMEAEENES